MTDQARINAFWLMAALLVVRVIFAAYPPLGVDETYAVAAARGYSLSFFDHPPMAFMSAVLAGDVLGSQSPFVFRLPTIIYGTITAWMMWKIGQALAGSLAGFWTLVLYVASPAFALSGAYIVPDAPLNMGASICVYWLIRITQDDAPAPTRFWVFAGMGLAVALASKYQAALIPVMALGFAVFTARGRQWFGQVGPYVAALVGLLGLLPTLLWNVQNDWASFAFHTGRTGDGVNLDNFALMLVGQALYLLPPVAVLAAVGLWRSSARSSAPERILLSLIALGPVVAFNAIYLFSERSFPHWTMPGWIFALPLAAALMAEAGTRAQARAMRWIVGFGAVVFVGLAAILVHVQTGVLTRYTHDVPPKWDRTSESFDYRALQGILEQRGVLKDGAIIATRGWIQAGFMSTALGGDWPMKVLRGEQHHFKFMPGQAMTGAGLLLHPDVLAHPRVSEPDLLAFAQRFDPDAKLLDPVIMPRGGLDYVRVSVIEMTFTR